MTVQSDTSHLTSRRTPPPRQRLEIATPDHQRSQPAIHENTVESGPHTNQLHEGDNFILPSIEGQEPHKTAHHNPFARKNPSQSHGNPPEALSRSQFARREDLSREFDIIDLTSPDDNRDVKRRRTENPFPDTRMHRRYEQIEPLTANERRYVPMASAHLDQSPGYQQYPLANQVDQEGVARTTQFGYGREPVHPTRAQPPVPLFRDLPATRPLEVLRHADEIPHSPSDRTNSAFTSRMRSLPSAQSHSDVAPRRNSLVPSNLAERVSVRHERVQPATPLEVVPVGREVRHYRATYPAGGSTSSRRQPIIELESVRSVEASNGSSANARSSNYVEAPRHRELEQLPREIVEYVQPDGTIREYVSAGRSIPTYRRMPIEVGEGERPRQTQQYILSTDDIPRSAVPTTYRRYALVTECR
jgi:hypothetical protein